MTAEFLLGDAEVSYIILLIPVTPSQFLNCPSFCLHKYTHPSVQVIFHDLPPDSPLPHFTKTPPKTTHTMEHHTPRHCYPYTPQHTHTKPALGNSRDKPHPDTTNQQVTTPTRTSDIPSPQLSLLQVPSIPTLQ